MAINLRPAAGTKVYVSTDAITTYNDDGTTGYGSVSTWVEVAGFDQIGEIGDSDEVGNFDSLTDGRIKYRAINDPGEFNAAPADDPTDAGQVLIAAAKAAAKGTAAERLRMKVEDEAGYGTWADVLVSSWTRNVGGASDVQTRTAVMPIIAGSIVEFTPA